MFLNTAPVGHTIILESAWLVRSLLYNKPEKEKTKQKTKQIKETIFKRQ